MSIPKQQIYDIIRIIADAIVSISAILLVQSCVLTRNVVRGSEKVVIESGSQEQKQSADSASINLKDFAK